MKQEVSFYQTDELATKALAPLVMKILSEKKRALIFCADQKTMSEIDGALWSHGRSTFIPHITIFDGEFNHAEQPVLISNREENSNQADYLIFLGSVPSDDFVKQFSRIFYFFSDSEIVAAKDIAKKTPPTFFHKKQNGKWTAEKLENRL